MKRLLYLVPATAWTLLIVVLSLISIKNFKGIGIENIFGIDKIAHVFMYCVLNLLILWGLCKLLKFNTVVFYLVFAFCTSLGLLMEILQFSMTTERSFDIYDLIANIVGIIIGSIIFYSSFNK